MSEPIICRSDCGACCIAPSISSAIPGMPFGKAAGVPCVQLNQDLRCLLFGSVARPLVCSSLKPNTEMCGRNQQEAMDYLTSMEVATRPDDQMEKLR
jgi:Fe-S-cluster containining protein